MSEVNIIYLKVEHTAKTIFLNVMFLEIFKIFDTF